MLTAPIAILIDAVSFVVSALCLGGIRKPEPPPRPSTDGHTTWMAIREGLRLVIHDPILRALAGAKATNEFFLYIWVSMLLVFLTRDLEMDPVVFGVLFAIGGVASFFGAVAARTYRAAARPRPDVDPQLLHHARRRCCSCRSRPVRSCWWC